MNDDETPPLVAEHDHEHEPFDEFDTYDAYCNPWVGELPKGIAVPAVWPRFDSAAAHISKLFEHSNTLAEHHDSVGDAAWSIVKRIEERQGQPFSTGWRNLDGILETAFRRGNLGIIQAQKKVGKTTVAVNIADALTKQGLRVFIDCIEMTHWELLNKLSRKTYTDNQPAPAESISAFEDRMRLISFGDSGRELSECDEECGKECSRNTTATFTTATSSLAGLRGRLSHHLRQPANAGRQFQRRRRQPRHRARQRYVPDEAVCDEEQLRSAATRSGEPPAAGRPRYVSRRELP